MDRRTLLKGVAGAAIGAPLATLATAAPAQAWGGTYDVAVCEQYSNRILLHPANVDWTPGNAKWAYSPPSAVVNGINTWGMLSDIRFRDTTAFGWVALMTASNGKVGIVNFGDDDALLWSARPYGNPHAVERIPDIGAVVVASARADVRTVTGVNNGLNVESGNHPDWDGYLTVYGPTNSDDPSTLGKVQEIPYSGAHGLWYDGDNKCLWALGTSLLTRYTISGDHRNTRLILDRYFSLPYQNGHSLDVDFYNRGQLLYTDGSHAQLLDKGSGASSLFSSTVGVKSFSRVASGEYFWVQALKVSDPADYPGKDDGQFSDAVNFFNPDGSHLGDHRLVNYGYAAQFYKARVSSVDFG